MSLGEAERELRARFLVDASGRDAFLAARQGQRKPRPGLGKVAIFAYFKGARRFPGREEGHVRIHIFPEGWFWYIPLARDETSVGCVLHQKVVKARRGSLQELFDDMVERCHAVRDNLQGSPSGSPSSTPPSNFAYSIEPVVGDRFLCVGDAVAFVDPIFSPGVFLAMQSGELAAGAILRAFRAEPVRGQALPRLRARGAPGHAAVRALHRVLLRSRLPRGLPASAQRAGHGPRGHRRARGRLVRRPAEAPAPLAVGFFQVVRFTRWLNLRRGVVLESRLDW